MLLTTQTSLPPTQADLLTTKSTKKTTDAAVGPIPQGPLHLYPVWSVEEAIGGNRDAYKLHSFHSVAEV